MAIDKINNNSGVNKTSKNKKTGQTSAADKAKLRIDIKAPTPDTPSMTMAIEKYISNNGK